MSKKTYPDPKAIFASHVGWSNRDRCVGCGQSTRLLEFTIGHPVVHAKTPFLIVCDDCFGVMIRGAWQMVTFPGEPDDDDEDV